jgi:hypothetical protein
VVHDLLEETDLEVDVPLLANSLLEEPPSGEDGHQQHEARSEKG